MSELEKTVAEILVKATNAAEAAGKFAMEQLPDVAQQYVLYVGISSLIGLLVGVGLILSIFPAYFTFKRWNNGDVDSETIGPTFTYGIFALAIGGVFVAKNFSDTLLAFFAPKVLLIQWAATLVK